MRLKYSWDTYQPYAAHHLHWCFAYRVRGGGTETGISRQHRPWGDHQGCGIATSPPCWKQERGIELWAYPVRRRWCRWRPRERCRPRRPKTADVGERTDEAVEVPTGSSTIIKSKNGRYNRFVYGSCSCWQGLLILSNCKSALWLSLFLKQCNCSYAQNNCIDRSLTWL